MRARHAAAKAREQRETGAREISAGGGEVPSDAADVHGSNHKQSNHHNKHGDAEDDDRTAR